MIYQLIAAQRSCVEWSQTHHEECTETEVQRGTECAQWIIGCCDWQPCKFFCGAIGLVCLVWRVVEKVVCVAFNAVVSIVCIVWSVVEVVLTPIALILEGLLMVPGIGRVLGVILGFFQEIFWRTIGFGENVVTEFGFRPLKKARVCFVILQDEDGPVGDPLTINRAFEDAQSIFRSEANVLLQLTGIHTVNAISPKYALDVGCLEGGGEAVWNDLGLRGTYFASLQIRECTGGSVGRILGFRIPVTVFIVRSHQGAASGCVIATTNYITLDGDGTVCLAHELAHRFGLNHQGPQGYVTYADECGGRWLHIQQQRAIRWSKYVTYF